MKYKVIVFGESFQVDFVTSEHLENHPDMHPQPEDSYKLYDKAGGYVFNKLSEVKKYLRRHFQEAKLSEATHWYIKEDIKDLTNDVIIEENKEAYNSLNLEYEDLRKKKEMMK